MNSLKMLFLLIALSASFSASAVVMKGTLTGIIFEGIDASSFGGTLTAEFFYDTALTPPISQSGSSYTLYDDTDLTDGVEWMWGNFTVGGKTYLSYVASMPNMDRRWMLIQDDGAFNPAIISQGGPDGEFALQFTLKNTDVFSNFGYLPPTSLVWSSPFDPNNPDQYGRGLAYGRLASDQPTDLFFFAPTSVTISPIPEPQTYALILAGLGLIGFMASRRKAV